MVRSAIENQVTIVNVPLKKKISWEDFQKRYLTREDSYKYEWLNGVIEKTPRTMNPNQFYIWENLSSFLRQIEDKIGHRLGAFPMEGDIFFNSNHRKPDIVFLNIQQIQEARQNIKPKPEFVIEILSPTDNINRVNKKVENYFAAGVKVLWHIFPEQEIIHVYSDSSTIRICRNTDICSAENVIEGYALPVKEVFK